MVSRMLAHTSIALSLSLATISCGSSSPDQDALADMGSTFTHKMMKPTGENPFSILAYECSECSFEQVASIQTPPGWMKGPTQVLLPLGEMRSRPSFEGVPDSIDFLPEVPGNEFELIAKTLEGRIVATLPSGAFIETRVMRDTLLWYPENSRVHELTNPAGDRFVMFVHEIDPADPGRIDFQDEDVLGYLEIPEGWTYSTRILDRRLELDSDGVVTVLALRGRATSAWEKL